MEQHARKTPDEIKKGLASCSADECNGDHADCPYLADSMCIRNICGDTYEYIQQLEAKNAELLEKIEKLERERDAAVSELPHNCWNCKYHLNEPIEETDDYGRTIHRYCDADVCYPDEENSSWEWRGVQKEECP